MRQFVILNKIGKSLCNVYSVGCQEMELTVRSTRSRGCLTSRCMLLKR